jgi:hypothetical protein
MREITLNPMRWIVPAVAVLLAPVLYTGEAQAQIASPALTPGTANIIVGNPGFAADPSFLPVNPAVMSWNGGSVFGLGQTNVDRDVEGPPKQSQEYSGSYGGFRWTGEKFAVGLETLSLSSDTSKVDFSYKTTGGGVSGKLVDWFSLGGGLNNSKSDFGASEDTVNGWSVGGSAKLGDIFYAGAGMGRENLDHKQSGNNYSDDRSVTQYGLAVYTGGGKGGGGNGGAVWHLEYNVLEKDDFTDNAGVKSGGFTRTTLVGEVNWKNILISYSSYTTTAKTGDGTLDGTAIEAGWAMDKSFFISARIQTNEEKDGSTKVADSNGMSINVGLQF